MRARLTLLLAASGLAFAGGGQAANLPVSGLAARGAVAGTDQLPDLPSGGANLQAVYASDLKKYALTSIDTYGADPTGVADSTVAIQTAINGGQSLTCSGVYKVSGTITLSTAASHGQQLVGAGPTDSGGATTAGRCVIRPTSAVTVAVKVDGAPFGGYIEGFGIENVTIDMANMSDVNTSVAFDQIQAYDGHYRNDRVINFGNYKLSWSFNQGSYTTKVEDSQGGIVSFSGASYTNAATTITLINCDIYNIAHDFYQNVTIMGGAIQRPYVAGVTPIVYLAPGTTPYGYLANTGGLYAAILSEIYDSLSFTSVGADWEQGGGFPSTYNDGVHGTLTLIRVLKVDNTAIDTTFINPGFAGMYLLDLGINTRVVGQQEGITTGTDIHNGQDLELGSVGVVGNIFGFTSLPNLLNAYSSMTYSISGATGVATFLGDTLQPAVDADGVFNIKTAAGVSMVDCATNVLQCAINNAATLAGYSDSFTTQAWNLNIPSAGTAQMLLKHAGTTTITLTGANGTAVFTGGINSTPIGGSSPSTGAFTTISANNAIMISGAAPTYLSGFSTGTPTITGSNSATFLVQIGATPSTTGVLTMPSGSTGWNCLGIDRTTAAGTIRETATTASSVTFALASTAASDVLQLQCTGY